MLKRAARSEAARRLGAALIAAYLAACLRTIRWRVDRPELLAQAAEPHPLVVVFWHDCLPLMPMMWTRVRRRNPARGATILASRHRDGRLIGEAMRRFGLGLVLGSSARPDRPEQDKGGASALRALLRVLAGGDIAILTPDGPRGPARQAAPGTGALAALSGAPVLAAAARVSPCLVLPSWDRMMLPLPFARGVLACEPPVSVARHDTVAGTAAIEAALARAVARADLLCPGPTSGAVGRRAGR